MDRVAIGLLPDGGKRALSAEERDSIQDVLDAAAAWNAGELPLNTAAHMGTLLYGDRPSPRYSRFVAVALTPRTDPRRAALLRMLDRIVAATHQPTRCGLFTREEMHEHDYAAGLVRQSREGTTA